MYSGEPIYWMSFECRLITQSDDVDGEIGNRTINALGKLDGLGRLLVALAVQDKREAYYRARPDFLHGHPFGVAYLPGWLNRVDLTRAAINEVARNLGIA